MKDYRIVASNAPVTTIKVAGTPHHYFHSERHGKMQAILIAGDANLEFAPNQAPTENSEEDSDCLPTSADCYDYSHFSDDELIRYNAIIWTMFWRERPFGWNAQDEAESNANHEAVMLEIAKRGLNE